MELFRELVVVEVSQHKKIPEGLYGRAAYLVSEAVSSNPVSGRQIQNV